MLQNEVEVLKTKLQIARNEINNLRQQVKNLQCKQKKDIEGVSRYLNEFRCIGCREKDEEEDVFDEGREESENNALQNQQRRSDVIEFQSIGVIRTAFAKKRAIPRQSNVAVNLTGQIELNNSTFTNPEHALEGLNEFSHLWIIYHFHRNASHAKAKVSPPRLRGERVGVFSTRSPHRPCPIGLSLVEIAKIEGNVITFFGTDMVDGTPVLDIKPYIPHYDAPMLYGHITDPIAENSGFYDTRQDPDGEETDLDLPNSQGAVGGSNRVNNKVHSVSNNYNNMGSTTSETPAAISKDTLLAQITNIVRVPSWVVANHHLTVLFNERSEMQITELNVDRQSIIDILEADPRSIYLRTKYGSQIFTFQLGEATVTCKFDDQAGTVNVVHVRPKESIDNYEESTLSSSK